MGGRRKPVGRPAALKARETGGPTVLTFASIADGEFVKRSGSTLIGGSPSGSGDVTAAASFGTDNRIIRSDGTGKGVQASAATLDDSGNISGATWHGTAVAAAYGGTGQTSYTTGDLLYASGAAALSKLAASTSGYVLTSNGAGAAPSWQAAASGSGATITHGTYAGAPGSPSDGDVHFVTGAPYYLSRESSAWVARTRSHGVALSLPGLNSMAAASWTYVSGASGTPSFVDYEQGLTLSMSSTAAVGPNLHPYVVSMSPAWASWTSLTIALENTDNWANFTKFMITLRESATGKMLHWGRGSATGARLLSQRGTGPTGALSNVLTELAGGERGLGWFRFVKNGTNIELWHSIDGVHYEQDDQVATTTPFTTNPDQVGFMLCVDSMNTTRSARMRVWHVAQV
jgi:hypothetical protein